MTALIVLVVLGFVFLIHGAKGGYVGAGGAVLVLFVLALLISAATSVDFSVVVIILLVVVAFIIAFSVFSTIESNKEQEIKQQEEEVSKQAFAQALQAQLAKVPHYTELHHNYVWLDGTTFCVCNKNWNQFIPDFEVKRIPFEDITYFVRYIGRPCKDSDIDTIPPMQGRYGTLRLDKYTNCNSTMLLYVKDGKDFILHLHYDDYYAICKLIPQKELSAVQEEKERLQIIDRMKSTPYKVFTQLVDDINDGSFGIKSKIQHIHYLKNGFYPYPIMKYENGHREWVHLTFSELRKEVASEYSVYDLDDFRWGTEKIDEKENAAQEKNLSISCKRLNKEIKDYLWKHHHDIIIAADKEDAFKRWSYRFQ